jgi:ABC-type transporter Mla MlaB component
VNPASDALKKNKGYDIMASNFRISTHQNSDNPHLKLAGDFDGTSAWELLNILKKNWGRVSKIFVHCSCLNRIDPFGRDVFQGNIRSVTGESTFLLFTGENAGQIAPEKRLCA